MSPVSLDAAVHVWRIPLDARSGSEASIARLAATLDAREGRRARHLRDPVQQRRYVFAHGITRLILGDRLGIPAHAVAWRLGAAGKPDLVAPGTRLRVNLSHSGDLALLAIAEGRDVGVDVEQVRDDLPVPALAARFYPPAEAEPVLAASGPEQTWRFLRAWTRKEACAKASGGRMFQALRLAVGPVEHPARSGVRCVGRGALSGTWTVRDLLLGGGSAGAVALTGTADYRVLVRTWDRP
jgi:4'-phosphopantetheinyl transferase